MSPSYTTVRGFGNTGIDLVRTREILTFELWSLTFGPWDLGSLTWIRTEFLSIAGETLVQILARRKQFFAQRAKNQTPGGRLQEAGGTGQELLR